ncbi:hypothetical protein INS49_014686 [Diaporthe citri]|uniref:uncharacterized protein n=1 Tax=Diaporthe citri TaxID=83186 RepID=UPI001C80C4DE|nr:uncharacterized protein INS49_014686 [Diaporthe citri]KAG6356812.1 hypothetical protein INS49_014686 [Diaporthe citri]
MGPEQGASVTPPGAAEPQPDCSLRLPTPPSTSSSSSNEVSGTILQPPPLPYVPGACFDIKPHKPPPPYDGGGEYYRPDPKEWNGDPWPWGQGSPDTTIEQYFAVPPRMTTPPPDQTVRRMEVTHQIRCGDPCKAQVVRCLVDGRDLVAKIFDPLYVGPDEYGRPPTHYSERYYSCEAAAYERIKERGLDGRFTPKYEGCWYLELPLRDLNGHIVRREVRLILQEFIPGDTMQALDERGEVDTIDPKVRMELLDRLTEIISQLEFIGVQSHDMHPRNLMIFKDAKNEWQITLIDFSHSRVQDLPNSKWRTRRGEDMQLPESPLTILWRDCWPDHCDGWVPKEYDGQTKESFERRLRWMKDRWEGSSQYGPVDHRCLPVFTVDHSSEEHSTKDES